MLSIANFFYLEIYVIKTSVFLKNGNYYLLKYYRFH